MDDKITIIIGESDEGHFILTKRNILRWGIKWPIIRFGEGRGILDFLRAARDGDCLASRRYVLLMAISMPDMDGLEVLRVLKGDPDFKHIPAMILTTAKDSKTVKDCLELGCDGLLSKPLDRESFFQALDNVGVNLETGQSMAEVETFE